MQPPFIPDLLTAGLVLVRVVLADPAGASAAVWRDVADFHGVVVRPLLAGEDTAAGPVDGTTLMALASAAMDADAPLDDVVLDDLMTLAERTAETEARATPDPRPVLPLGTLDGRFVPLALTTPRDDLPWHFPLAEARRAAAEAAVDAVLSAFPGRPTAAESWPYTPHLCRPPAVPLSEEAVDLPLALWLLGRSFGLEAPALLAAGRFDGREFVATSQPGLAADRDLLVPATGGWELRPADGSKPRRTTAPRTLDGAASVVWGAEWERCKRDAHAAELDRLGWHFIDWSETPEEQPLPDLPVVQVHNLQRYCLDKSAPGSVAILGGTRQSGRSAVVRQVARRLNRHKRPWLVQVIAGATRVLPDRHTALEVATHALGAGPGEEPARRLLVFEDLQPTGDGNAAEVLRLVAQRLRITVLGVLEYAEGSTTDWDTDDTFVATAVVGQEARRLFVEELAAADRTLDPARAFDAVAARTPVDLRTLTKLMKGDTGAAARRSARFAELDEDRRAALVRAAALSLVSADVPEATLATLRDEDRELFGIGPGRAPSTARLTGTDDCLVLLELHAPAKPGAPRRRAAVGALVEQQVRPELEQLLMDGDPLVVERLRGVRLYQEHVARSLLRTADQAGLLAEWAATAPLLSVADLTGLSELMPDRMAQKVVEKLAVRACQATEPLTPGGLLALMHARERFDTLLPTDINDDLVSWLIDAVDDVFHRSAGRPDERFAMLGLLERMDRDDAADLVAARALDVLTGLRVRVEDYRLVQKVDQLHRRVSRRTWQDAPLFPVDQEGPVEELLERKPDPADGIPVLFEAMNLRLCLVDRGWLITYEKYQTALNQALRSATAHELALALQGIRSPIPQFSTWLLNSTNKESWQDFPDRARTLLHKASPSDAATLLGAVARANGTTAQTIISGGPDPERLARTLAERAATSGDAKGIGQLLSAAQSIEDLFQEGASSFANDLAETLGVQNVLKMIRYDPRTSVRYHVIKGVWDARASYRGELLDEALTVVVDSLRHGRKHWGAEIALRLMQEPELGLIALEELHDRTTPQMLLRGMTSANTAHGRAAFHRLGRAVHPEVPALFLQKWELEPFVEGLTTASPTAALEVCAAVARTLADADLPEPGPLIAAETGGAELWARRLREGRNQEAFVQAVRHLTALRPETAGEVLDRLRATKSRRRVAGQDADALLMRLRHALFAEPTCAPALLRAVHRVRPQLARDLAADVAEDKHATFVFCGELQQIQNPVAQSAAALDLVRVGVARTSPLVKSWIDQVKTVRMQSVQRFAGPRAVTSLLRMLAAWEQGWGPDAAKRVNVRNVVRRLSRGALTDVTDAVALIRTTAALDNPDGARQILAELLRPGIARLADHVDLDTLCALVDVAGELAPEEVPKLSHALGAALRSYVGRPVVSDERAHWLRVGRASRTLNRVKAGPLSVGDPRLPPNAAYAPVVAWAATGLDQPGWGNDALGRAAGRLAALRSQPTVPTVPAAPVSVPLPDVTDRACALSATGRGCAPELRESRTDWDVGSAPFWLLRILYAEAADDAYLAAALAAGEPVVRERVDRVTSRADWDAGRLQLMLDARGVLGRDRRNGYRGPYPGPRPRGA
ncbi:hypothetical protein [Streptomyces fulvoviolaceus]|uniref:hypothetical protein n=1 Tax=Streptomyces fulvoviolaceus TaxID=285535 RepID=UPI0021BF9AD6|nr:hypothetical protein [Streptomyces fulvoviolaceus]MCT9075077.1 hypothetical protein [Streptomyces fulvoviolaceus]